MISTKIKIGQKKFQNSVILVLRLYVFKRRDITEVGQRACSTKQIGLRDYTAMTLQAIVRKAERLGYKALCLTETWTQKWTGQERRCGKANRTFCHALEEAHSEIVVYDFVLCRSCCYPHLKAGFRGLFLDTILKCLHRTHSHRHDRILLDPGIKIHCGPRNYETTPGTLLTTWCRSIDSSMGLSISEVDAPVTGRRERDLRSGNLHWKWKAMNFCVANLFSPSIRMATCHYVNGRLVDIGRAEYWHQAMCVSLAFAGATLDVLGFSGNDLYMCMQVIICPVWLLVQVFPKKRT